MSHPHAPAEVLRSGYAVQFLSCFTGFACFESITGARDGILRSTTTAAHVAFWPTREAALAWLDAMGYRENDAVPIGVGHMTCGVRPFSADLVDPQWCCGSLFEVPKGCGPANLSNRAGVMHGFIQAPTAAVELQAHQITQCSTCPAPAVEGIPRGDGPECEPAYRQMCEPAPEPPQPAARVQLSLF